MLAKSKTQLEMIEGKSKLAMIEIAKKFSESKAKDRISEPCSESSHSLKTSFYSQS